jgi:uncharacterized protein (DUF1778 family)
MAGSEATNHSSKARRVRAARLGFRVDGETNALVKRAAELERRSLTEFCLTALADAARTTIARHETLVLSERDREVFFDILINPPEINPRLRRGFEAERLHIEP